MGSSGRKQPAHIGLSIVGLKSHVQSSAMSSIRCSTPDPKWIGRENLIDCLRIFDAIQNAERNRGGVVGQATRSHSGALGWIVAAVMAVIALGQCSSEKAAESAQAVGTQKYVQARSLNCRSAPSESSTILRAFAHNEPVVITDKQKGWGRVKDAPECWVSARFLSTVPAPAQVKADTRSALLTNYNQPRKEKYSPPPPPRRERVSSSGSAYYRNCAAARAAGAAPVMADDPGYSRRLDRDGDGVGCE